MYIIKVGKKYLTVSGKKSIDINTARRIETLRECSLFMAKVLSTSEIGDATILSLDGAEDNSGFNMGSMILEHGGTEIIERKKLEPLNEEMESNDNYYKEAFEEVGKLDSLFSDIKSVYNMAVDVRKQFKRLNNEYKTTELEICDIYHYIEFNNLNACDGFKVYKKLHDTLKRRRAIKDSLNALTSLDTMFNDNNIDNLLDVIHCSKRRYTPRTDKALLKKGI